MKRWLSLKEATGYCPLGKARLQQLALSGVIIGGRDVNRKKETWFFDRESIDRYYSDMSGCESQREIDAAVSELKRKIGLN